MRVQTAFWTLCLMALAAAAGLGGCAAAAVPAMVEGAGGDISFTSTTANRAFTYSMTQVHAAALAALESMRIAKTKDDRKGDSFKMQGRTRHLKILITLTTITPTVTKASIDANRNWLMKDQSVAVEILIQMDKALGSQPPQR